MKTYLIATLLAFTCTVPASAQTLELNAIANEALDSVPSLGSMLVWQNDARVFEAYFNGADGNTDFKVKSVTKTVVSALAGIARDRGLLPDLDTPVLALFPEYAEPLLVAPDLGFPELITDADALKRTVTLRDLLTMRTGYVWDDNSALSSRAFNSSSDPVRFTLDLPFETGPGTAFKYCTAGSHVLGVAVAKSVHQNLKEFADTALFAPIGVSISSWSNDRLGRTMGGTELSMKASDMVKFGMLYLNEGMANGKQVISKAWINESTSEQAVLNEWDVLPGANGYGYYWWRRTTHGHQAYVASGYGGQLICVIPDLHMVITTTCIVDDRNRGRSEIKRLHHFIDRIVALRE